MNEERREKTGATKRTARKAPTKNTVRKSATSSNRRAPKALTAATLDQIRDRAYFIYLERGAGHGNDQADWFQAERELTVTSSGS